MKQPAYEHDGATSNDGITWTRTASVLNPRWRYTPSYATDVRKTIAAARRRIGKQTRVRVK